MAGRLDLVPSVLEPELELAPVPALVSFSRFDIAVERTSAVAECKSAVVGCNLDFLKSFAGGELPLLLLWVEAAVGP